MDFLQIFSTILGLYSGFDILLLSRFVSGLCIGINSVITPLYIGEIIPDKLQALSSAIQNTMMSLGCMVSFFFGLYMPLSKELH